MVNYQPILPPTLQLFRLTLHDTRVQSNDYSAYSMGENVQDAFQRHIARILNRKEDISTIVFIEGDLANPRTQPTTNSG